MKLRQQFAVLTAVVALLIAISCGVGYYMASSMLTDSIEHQLTAIVKGEGDNVDSWVANKAAMLNGYSSSAFQTTSRSNRLNSLCPFPRYSFS